MAWVEILLKEVVAGCVDALNENKRFTYSDHRKRRINKKELEAHNYDKARIEILDAKIVISPNDSPVMAIRRKKDSSLNKGLQLVKQKKVEGIISAGSTGAFMAGSLFIVGRIKGIDRPALAPVMPGKNAPFMVIDVGANAECKPKNLLQFALMGKIYFEKILNVKKSYHRIG